MIRTLKSREINVCLRWYYSEKLNKLEEWVPKWFDFIWWWSRLPNFLQQYYIDHPRTYFVQAKVDNLIFLILLALEFWNPFWQGLGQLNSWWIPNFHPSQPTKLSNGLLPFVIIHVACWEALCYQLWKFVSAHERLAHNRFWWHQQLGQLCYGLTYKKVG